MKKGLYLVVVAIISIITACYCFGDESLGYRGMKRGKINMFYPKLETEKLESYIQIETYQQSKEYTCGPAALLMIAHYFNPENYPLTPVKEMEIAREAGTRDLNAEFPGTKPEEMLDWLTSKGFQARLSFEAIGDYSQLTKLRECVQSGKPVIVEWIDWGGHWVIAVGYDTMGTENIVDDIIVFADPYDRNDVHPDGLMIFNAEKFYWMWFDALYFGKITWRTMIEVGL